jgi:hypothetical protein
MKKTAQVILTITLCLLAYSFYASNDSLKTKTYFIAGLGNY